MIAKLREGRVFKFASGCQAVRVKLCGYFRLCGDKYPSTAKIIGRKITINPETDFTVLEAREFLGGWAVFVELPEGEGRLMFIQDRENNQSPEIIIVL